MKIISKNNSKLKYFILVFVAFLSFSCENSIEGINTDPLAATVIDPELLLPQVFLGGIANPRTVEGFQMSTHSQQWSFSAGFGVFVNPERGNIGPNTTNNLWSGYYLNGLRNLRQIQALTETNNPTARNIIGQAKIMEAFIYLSLTQIYGEVPFTESLQPDTFSFPNFDTQETILRGIPTLIDEAIAELSASTGILSSGDLLYRGDRQNWVRFGNSIKLKALMLIANVDPTSVAADIQAVANQPLITEVAHEAEMNYTTTAGNQNPIYTLIVQFAGGNNNFYAAGLPLINIMNANNDPRRATYFDTNTSSQYGGLAQGSFTRGGSASQVSLNIIKADLADRYLTASEVNFFLAEAAQKGWITGNANQYYNKGISVSMDYFDGKPGEISTADKNAFLNSSRGNISLDSDAVALNKIYEEHYVAQFTRHLETWTLTRRNNVPALLPITGNTLTSFINRYQIPLSEISSNPNAPTTLPAFTEKMYFQN